jgi:hypothetical protein
MGSQDTEWKYCRAVPNFKSQAAAAALRLRLPLEDVRRGLGF